jgi:chromosome segregation ATPase
VILEKAAMKILQCSLLLLLLIFAVSCDSRKHEIESFKQDNAALKNALEKLLIEQKLVQTNLDLLREVCKEQKEKVLQREDELNRLHGAYTNLEAQLTEARKESDETKKELLRLRDSQNQQATQQEKTQQTQKMKTLMGKLLAKLDRLLQENPRFSSATLKSDLSDEENRLKSLANSQKSEIKEMIAEMESLGFPNTSKQYLEILVDKFISAYGLYASYDRMNWSAILVRGQADENLSSKSDSFKSECNDVRKQISEFKY